MCFYDTYEELKQDLAKQIASETAGFYDTYEELKQIHKRVIS